MALTAAMITSALAACSKDNNDESSKAPEQSTAGGNTGATQGGNEDKPTEAPTTKEVKDLGGIEVIIGNWWQGEAKDPETQFEEDQLAYREAIQKDNNFTIMEKKIADWGGMQELAVSTITASTPEASIFVLDSSWVPAMLNQHLFYPLNTLESFNFEDDKWNAEVKEMLTFDGSTYGMAVGSEPRLGIFFNKRMFEEAGMDPEYLYDLQKNGEWTWEKFEEVCAALTRDTDQDGLIDSYALASFSKDFYSACVYSNGAEFVGKDESGYFYNATGSDAFLEAMNWGYSLYEKGYVMSQPEGTEWNWYEAAFLNGQAAMRVCEEYNKTSLAAMEDDWGFVMFPAPAGKELVSITRENVLIIPACFDAETAEKIAYAYNLFTEDIPGYEDDDSWKRSYYSAYRDTRAVDETLQQMMHGDNIVLRTDAYVYGIEIGDIVYSVDAMQATPAQKIEEIQQSWDSLIEDANAALKGE